MDNDKALCIALKEALSKENTSLSAYERLLDAVDDEASRSIIEELLERKVADKERLISLAKESGCRISTREPERKLYADLPLKERIRIARDSIRGSYG